MRDTTQSFINRILGRGIAFAFLFTILIINNLPFWQSWTIKPQLLSICFYHGVVYRPDLLSAGLIFIIGCLQDGLAGYPLGVSSLKWMSLYGMLLLSKQFLFNQSFGIIWGGFILWSFADSLLTCMIFSYLKGKILFCELMFLEMGLTVALYPFFAFCLIRLQHKFFKL
jgi:cell shape-determining protein MreD